MIARHALPAARHPVAVTRRPPAPAARAIARPGPLALGPLALGLWLAAAPALRANDGYMGVGAGGLEFQQTDAIAMVSEDLYLSRGEVRVTYRFRNLTDQPVTAQIGFPMPPLIPQYGDISATIPPELEDVRGIDVFRFETLVDGVAPQMTTSVRALPAPDSYGGGFHLLNELGDQDITARLEQLGLPITFEPAPLMAAIAALPQAERARLEADGLVRPGFEDEELVPTWALVVTHGWTQIFPPGRDLEISHRYRPVPGGSVYYLSDDLRQQYCVDDRTAAAIERLQTTSMTSENGLRPIMYFLDYVLTTAGTWAGPIGTFTVTIDKGHPEALVSFCADGVTKTGPTTWQYRRTNFVPDRELQVLFVDVPRD